MIGIIGGTGLYRIDGLEQLEERSIETPFGPPSAPVVIGSMAGNRVAFLPRHGKSHELLPGEIPFRANIWALKEAGVLTILSVSAVGSLEEGIRPGDLALVSQYLDFTKGGRSHTFFGDGLVAHVSTAEPSCNALSEQVRAVAKSLGFTLHPDKTYACVEGPRLGNRAESHFLRGAGCHVVGMTNVPEVYLAREAQLCYVTLAVATDYDCWLEDPAQHAAADRIVALYHENLGRVQEIIRKLVANYSGADSGHGAVCACRRALRGAVLTPESTLSSQELAFLNFLRA